MNARHVVSALLDAITPGEILKSTPHLFSTWKFIPSGHISWGVERWEKGSYRFLGYIGLGPKGYYARDVWPSGTSGSRIVASRDAYFDDKRGAAKHLWGKYLKNT